MKSVDKSEMRWPQWEVLLAGPERFDAQARTGGSAARRCQDFCVRGGLVNWLLTDSFMSSGPCQAAGGGPG